MLAAVVGATSRSGAHACFMAPWWAGSATSKLQSPQSCSSLSSVFSTPHRALVFFSPSLSKRTPGFKLQPICYQEIRFGTFLSLSLILCLFVYVTWFNIFLVTIARILWDKLYKIQDTWRASHRRWHAIFLLPLLMSSCRCQETAGSDSHRCVSSSRSSAVYRHIAFF